MHRLSPLLLLIASSAAAQPDAPPPEPVRIGSFRGDVWIHRGSAREPAREGSILSTGDRIVSGTRSRAIVQLDPAQWVQVDGTTDLQIVRMEPASHELQLATGSITCHLRDAAAGELRIGTPGITARVFQEGVYRVSINKRGESEVLAIEGEAEVIAPTGTQPVAAGRKLIARGPASDPEFRIVNGIGFWRRVITALDEHGRGGADVSTSDDDSRHRDDVAEEKPKQEAPKQQSPIAREPQSISRPPSGGGARR